MGRVDKLYEKAKNSPSNLTFSQLCSLAEAVGFELRKPKGRKKSGTSHHVYKHPTIKQMMNFQSDSGRAISYQVKQLIQLIDDNKLLPKDR